MRLPIILTATLVGWGVLSGALPCCAEDSTKEFFNGKDLTGWEGLAEYWSVKDGAIPGSLRSQIQTLAQTHTPPPPPGGTLTNTDPGLQRARVIYAKLMQMQAFPAAQRADTSGKFGAISQGYTDIGKSRFGMAQANQQIDAFNKMQPGWGESIVKGIGSLLSAGKSSG